MSHAYKIWVVGWPMIDVANESQAEEFAAALASGLKAQVYVIRSDGELVHQFFGS